MSDPDLILDARRGILRFGILALVALALLGIMGLMACDLVFGLNPNAPDRAMSIAGRVALGLTLLGLSAAFVAAVLLYGERYIVTIRRRGARLEIVTLALWGLNCRVVEASRVSLGAAYAPVVRGRQNVDAPWQTLRIDGIRVPFIIDLQARYYDEARLRRALRDARPK